MSGDPIDPAEDVAEPVDDAARGVHRRRYRVRFDEAGPDGLVRASALLRYAQDIAWTHSERQGFDRAWYEQRSLAWLVRAAELVLHVPIPLGAELELATSVAGYRKVWARRRCEVRSGDRLAAMVDTDWVLVDGRGAPVRIPPEFEAAFPSARLAVQLARVSLVAAPPDADRRALRVRPHELDPNDHVNNAAYVDWLEESVLAARSGTAGDAALTALPRRYRLEYATAAGPAADLHAETRFDDGWSHRLTFQDGREVLRARLES
jgi:acyl-ACP thioesterase